MSVHIFQASCQCQIHNGPRAHGPCLNRSWQVMTPIHQSLCGSTLFVKQGYTFTVWHEPKHRYFICSCRLPSRRHTTGSLLPSSRLQLITTQFYAPSQRTVLRTASARPATLCVSHSACSYHLLPSESIIIHFGHACYTLKPHSTPLHAPHVSTTC